MTTQNPTRVNSRALLTRRLCLQLATLAFFPFSTGFVFGILKPKAHDETNDVSVSTNRDAPYTVLSPDTELPPIAADTVEHTWREQWDALQKSSPTPQSVEALCKLLEELARSDPEKAMQLSLRESNWWIRDQFKLATLEGWARNDPESAANYAISLRPEERRDAVAAVFQGTNHDPNTTVQTALALCHADPEPAGDYGHAAIAALTDVGAFSEAIEFSQAVGEKDYPYLIKSAYFQWSRNQPSTAFAALEAINDPAEKAIAKAEVISGWSWADAPSLANAALDWQPSQERSDALAQALPLWIEREPGRAIEWIQTNDNGPDFDPGIAAMANMQSVIQSRPVAALDIAKEISNPELRQHTLRSVFRQWVEASPSDAQSYASTIEDSTVQSLFLTELEDLYPAQP